MTFFLGQMYPTFYVSVVFIFLGVEWEFWRQEFQHTNNFYSICYRLIMNNKCMYHTQDCRFQTAAHHLVTPAIHRDSVAAGA